MGMPGTTLAMGRGTGPLAPPADRDIAGGTGRWQSQAQRLQTVCKTMGEPGESEKLSQRWA